MLVSDVVAALGSRRDRSAWDRGVTAYALDMLGELESEDELYPRTVEKVLLNGAPTWHDYSWGGCALIYDRDIAERLCCPSELRRCRNGERRPNAREEWLDAQARACFQACMRVKKIVCRGQEGLAMSEAIGKQVMDAILAVSDELRECVRDTFTPCEGIYRINDFGEYVSEEDWLNVWADHPDWWPRAWMLADNGQFTADQVSRMSVDKIETIFNSAAFEPEYAYYTEAGEDGQM